MRSHAHELHGLRHRLHGLTVPSGTPPSSRRPLGQAPPATGCGPAARPTAEIASPLEIGRKSRVSRYPVRVSARVPNHGRVGGAQSPGAQGVDWHARAHEVRGKGPFDRRQRRLAGVLDRQQDQPEPVLHPPLVRQAPPEVVREDQAPARLAARDRLAVPGLHARGAAGDPRRQEGRERPPQREGRRDQGHHPREGRQDPDGEGLPHPRPLRGHDGHRPGVLQAPRRGRSRAATSAPTTTRSCTTTAPPPCCTAAARCSPSTSPTAAT